MAEFNLEDYDFDDVQDESEENTPKDDYIEVEESEKSFSNLPEVPETGSDIRSAETQKTVDEFYKSITDLGWDVNRDVPIDYKAVFIKYPKTKQLYVKYEDRKIILTSSQNPFFFLNYPQYNIMLILPLLEMFWGLNVMEGQNLNKYI